MPRPRHKQGEEIEMLPDAWERFERAIKVIAKAKPIHRVAKKKGKRKAR